MAAISNITFSPQFPGMDFFVFWRKLTMKLVSNDPLNIVPALIKIMTRRRLGDEPLSAPTMASFTNAYSELKNQSTNGFVCFGYVEHFIRKT